MDWIHCNICFDQLGPGVTLSLTSCGHMFCKKCIDNGVKAGICKICKSACSTMQLVPDMKPDVQDFFTEPEEIVSKLTSVLDFQRKHRMRLTSYWIQLSKKYQAAKDEVMRLNELAHKLNNALKESQKQNKAMKAIIRGQSPNSQYKSTLTSPFATSFTPVFKLTPPANACSTPKTNPQYYQSNLLSMSRLTKQRLNTHSGLNNTQSQRINPRENLSGPDHLSPNTPGSVGYFSTPASSCGSDYCGSFKTPPVAEQFSVMSINRRAK